MIKIEQEVKEREKLKDFFRPQINKQSEKIVQSKRQSIR